MDLNKEEEDDNSSLAAHILATSSKFSSLCSIYRVPTKMREKDEARFDPYLVSIGPYHYKKRTFKFTEEHKKRYTQDLFSRAMPPTPTPTTANYNKNKLMKDIIKAIKDLEVEARACYAETIHLNSDEFVTMMVVDGCFILELLYKYRERRQADGSLLCRPEDKNDPAFHGVGSTALDLLQDLLLLENQLPMLVLNCLFQLTRGPNHNTTLNQLIITSLERWLPTDAVSADDLIQSDKHILDLLRNILLGSQKMVHRPTNWAENCATDLREVGIKFRAKENATSSLDITFSDNDGVLEIPLFYHGIGMEILIPNIIALEHSDLYYTYQITSYAYLLSVLIKSEHDVELLARQGVIDTLGRDYQLICNDIKDLRYGVKFRPFYYDELCKRMDSYCRSDWMRLRRMWHKWKEMLKRDYFGSPWAYFSFSAAVVLLGLTLTQTIYSIKSYSPSRG